MPESSGKKKKQPTLFYLSARERRGQGVTTGPWPTEKERHRHRAELYAGF